ncbi:hypothetical protein JW948_18225 [bacterium]|nr:hypothetical protein [bacterium]
MKRNGWVLMLCSMMLPLLAMAQSPVFSVRIGPVMQASQIGFQYGSLQPYVGIDYVSAGLDATIDESYSIRMDDVSPFMPIDNNSMTLEGSVRILMPHAGVRYYLNTNVTKPYVFAGIFKAFPSIDGKVKYSYTYYNEEGLVDYSASGTEKLDKNTRELIEDMLGVWGLNFGFGAEYTVNEHFSVGGEFGFKMARTSVDNTAEELITSDDYYYYYYYYSNYPDAALRSVTDTDANVGLTFSHASVCLNFHF